MWRCEDLAYGRKKKIHKNRKIGDMMWSSRIFTVTAGHRRNFCGDYRPLRIIFYSKIILSPKCVYICRVTNDQWLIILSWCYWIDQWLSSEESYYCLAQYTVTRYCISQYNTVHHKFNVTYSSVSVLLKNINFWLISWSWYYWCYHQPWLSSEESYYYCLTQYTVTSNKDVYHNI